MKKKAPPFSEIRISGNKKICSCHKVLKIDPLAHILESGINWSRNKSDFTGLLDFALLLFLQATSRAESTEYRENK